MTFFLTLCVYNSSGTIKVNEKQADRCKSLILTRFLMNKINIGNIFRVSMPGKAMKLSFCAWDSVICSKICPMKINLKKNKIVFQHLSVISELLFPNWNGLNSQNYLSNCVHWKPYNEHHLHPWNIRNIKNVFSLIMHEITIMRLGMKYQILSMKIN